MHRTRLTLSIALTLILCGLPTLAQELGPAPGTKTVLPRAAIAQSDDKTDRFLLQAAAPNRTVGPDDRPNVLFMIVDDLNVALGSYLDSARHPQYATARTPNIDRLAAEGILFEHAYVQNPVCNPSRVSFLSGLRV